MGIIAHHFVILMNNDAETGANLNELLTFLLNYRDKSTKLTRHVFITVRNVNTILIFNVTGENGQ